MSKIILVGANHAGTACANTILDNYKDTELVIFDRNSNISYLGCGTALWVGRQIDGPDGLFYSSKEILASKGATIHMETDVYKIDYDKKVVYARDKDGKEFTENYDKIVLATGSLPIEPKIPGRELKNVQCVKLYQDGQQADACMYDKNINTVAVIGAGYIGVEIVEAAKRRGKNALLFESLDTCLANYYDPWFSKEMDKVLADNGVQTHYGQMVKEIKGDGIVKSIVTDKGEYETDMVILSIGFKPNNALGADKLELIKNGAYKVDRHQRTSLKDVYAIGDCATVYSNAVEDTSYIALATNAVRSGVVAGHNICGTDIASVGVQGSNGISIFGYNMVSTGLNLEACKRAGYDAQYTDFEDLQKPAFIRENNYKVKIRIVYDRTTRRILGAQIASRQDISMAIHMFSLAIQEKVTIDTLKLLDIFFLPHFNQPYNYITMAALTAE